MKNKIIIVLICWLTVNMVGAPKILAQTTTLNTPLTIGQNAPNFSLIVQAKGKGKTMSKSLADYSGQWLVMEFWSRSCLSCIESFPKLEQLRQDFFGKVEFLLIGKNDLRYNDGIEKFYQRFRRDWSLQMNVAFDTTIFKILDVSATPTVIVISPQGKIVMASVGAVLTKTLLNQLISEDQSNQPQIAFSKNTLMSTLVNLDSSSIIPHYSKLAPLHRQDQRSLNLNLYSSMRLDSFYTSPIHLGRLYLLGHFGKAVWGPMDSLSWQVWPKPLLEMSDTSNFIFNYGQLQGNYSYTLRTNPLYRNPLAMMHALRADLDYWFPYMSFTETREMPVLKLIVRRQRKTAKLRSATTESWVKGDATGYQLKKISMIRLLGIFRKYLSNQVIIDATSIDFLVDLELRANMLDFHSIAKALHPYGLDLIQIKHPLRVLVIRDR